MNDLIKIKWAAALIAFAITAAGCSAGQTDQASSGNSQEDAILATPIVPQTSELPAPDSGEHAEQPDDDRDEPQENDPATATEMPSVPSDQPADPAETDEKPAVTKQRQLPKGFVYVDEIIPSIETELRYFTDNNFTGEAVDGYKAPIAILSEKAALALKKASVELEEKGYRFKIYDSYRPAKAVKQFVSWSKASGGEERKEDYYPNIEKELLFKKGYISSRSGHSRGSTVDLSIVHADTGEDVDMGSGFDMLDPISNEGTSLITKEQAANRKLLKDTMVKYGFKPYSKEWWHFTLENEPFPKTYFDFDIE
ncbi:M15 family metallopeptidase [Paenibacillus sp. NPDC058071]|uniref:M15 family metallopeptidase n=1 Tax=Paenibacillus sp. NPDC058071 TaxID=3346326 RepID=UPI0036DAA64A